MNHPLDQYGQITVSDIKMKKKSLQESLDTSQPINVFFKLVYDGFQYASDVSMLYTPAQVLQIAYHTVSLSVIYSDAYKYWRSKPSADKTWENFRTFFALEYN